MTLAIDAWGRGLVRWRWVVLAVWAGLGAVAARGARGVAERLDVRGGSLARTEASEVGDILRARFSHDVGETFLVVVSGPPRSAAPGSRLVLDSLSATLGRLPYVRAAVSLADSVPPGSDPRTALLAVVLRVGDADSVLKLVTPLRIAVREALSVLPGGEQYRALVTGDTPLERDMLTVTTRDVERAERRLVPVAGAILIVVCGSLVAALVPLALGFLTILVALALVAALAGLVPMSIYALNVTTMIGLGVGIDYALLVVTRFREELARGLPRDQAVARTLASAGMTVATSGLTVMIGFAALLVTPLIETRSIGLAGVVVGGVAVLVALTLLPALLAVLGPALRRPHPLLRWPAASRLWSGWAGLVSRRPGWALIAGGLVMAALTAPALRIRIGLPSRGWWPAETEAGEGMAALARLGSTGEAQPLHVLVQFPSGQRATDARSLRGLRVLSDSLAAEPRVRQVRSVVDPPGGKGGGGGSLLENALFYSDLGAARARYPVFLGEFLSSDATVARLDVVLADSTSLMGAMDVVRRARRLVAAGPPGLTGARVLVGGFVAQHVDLQDDLLRRVPLLVALVLAAMGLTLGLIFRSILIPAKAILLNAVSVAAALGMIVLVFQWSMGADAIFVAVPVLVFAGVYGLSMDYEVFLLSRIREAFQRSGQNDQATVEGLSATASVITSAALLMITVFGAFAFSRVLVIQVLGFGLAVAVLLDATVIRLVLVPAVMHLAGRWNWWPGVRLSGER